MRRATINRGLVALLILGISLDFYFPKIIAAGSFQIGALLRDSYIISNSFTIRHRLIRFAGHRNYAPAQIAMYQAFIGPRENSTHDIALAWLHGADAQGYEPAIFFKNDWRLHFLENNLLNTVSHFFDIEFQKPEYHTLDPQQIWLEVHAKISNDRLLMLAALQIAISFGDPTARDILKELKNNISDSEFKTSIAVLKRIIEKFIPPSIELSNYCRQLNRDYEQALTVGLKQDFYCLMSRQQNSNTSLKWRKFILCAEKEKFQKRHKTPPISQAWLINKCGRLFKGPMPTADNFHFL